MSLYTVRKTKSYNEVMEIVQLAVTGINGPSAHELFSLVEAFRIKEKYCLLNLRANI